MAAEKKGKAACAVMQTARVLGRRWCIGLVEEVALKGPQGFNAFSEAFGAITPTQLSRQLRELVAEGLLEKAAAGRGGQARVQYRLTRKGKAFRRLVEAVKRFEARWGRVPRACPSTPCSACGRMEPAKAGAARSR